MQTADLATAPVIIEDTWNQERSIDVLKAYIDARFAALDFDETELD